MAGAILSITYEVNGVPIELTDLRDWARAVERQRIRRETPVTIYRAGEAPRVERAEAVPELRALFSGGDPPAHELRPPAAPVETLLATPVAAAPPPAAPKETAQAQPGDGREAAPADLPSLALGRSQEPPEPMNWRPLIAIGAIFGFLFIVVLLTQPRPSNSYSEPVTINTAEPANLAMAEEPQPEMPVANLIEEPLGNDMTANMVESNAAAPAMPPDINGTMESEASNTVAESSGRPFYVINRCHYMINLWVYYRYPPTGWRTFGPRTLDTGRSLDLTTDTPEFYVYAETIGSNIRWSANGAAQYGGLSTMRRLTAQINSRGNYFLELTCA